MAATTRLLILDDDPLTGQTIANIAIMAGVEARYVDEPAAFFQQVKDWQPDFIALDLVMPRMDGVQVMVELARLGCHAEIIISSGVGGRVLDAAARSAAEHGLNIAGVLAKPFSPARLRALLKDEGAADTPSTAMPTVAELTTASDSDISHQDLQTALDRKQITLVYQPKINCRTGLLAGFEALARWHHPDYGPVGPDRFIPLAERYGLIDALTESVMVQGLRWLSQLPLQLDDAAEFDYLRRRLRDITLSINISASSLNNIDLFERMNEYCQSMGIRPERLIFELTESCAMEDPISSLDILTRLRMKGFHLSIDDFGTGYSSMLQLARLPFSEIKIDKSFVMTAAGSKESRTVIKTIIDLGHGLGLYTSAEGIESDEALEYLRSIGCDLAQGYAIARPMPAEAVLDWLREGQLSDESRRLQVLHSLNILDTPPDERFDRITRLAARLFRVPIALFTLVDSNRQWFKSSLGLDVTETARDISFCTHAIEQEDVMVIPDATQNPAFKNNPLVLQDPNIRFYAGCPVHADTGSRLGTLCLIDREPREFSRHDEAILRHAAQMIENELTADFLAHVDPLTNMLNRRGFDSRAQEALSLCHDADLQACLFLLDLVNFKAFNQQHGPAAGDRALIEFSRLLRETFRGSDLIARYGDDDFVILMVDIDPLGPQAALRRLRTIARAIEQPHPFSYNAGWALLESGDDSVQQLVLRASDRMHSEDRH
ncbi:MAG: diguanylate cyclase [Gammaproteobacteria bacterium]|nr:diguanylate cyclase [Gammaproteobacteria bacterium]|tara:strand:- start:1300 stop:3456 length:2157 start_codon:yes stop_codon:yes gene_type:complete